MTTITHDQLRNLEYRAHDNRYSVGGNVPKFGRFNLRVYNSQSDFADGVSALPKRLRDTSSWAGFGVYGWNDHARMLRTGNDRKAPKLDKYYSELEDALNFDSKGMATVNAVTGGSPNVPAFLAGHPMAMRQRRRIERELAPLAVFVDLTSSGGISVDNLEKRGMALLAFVKFLAGQRPVKLYVGCGMYPSDSRQENKAKCVGVAFPVDTAPLDIARALQAVAEVATSRGSIYGMAYDMADSPRGCLHWPFNSVDRYRQCGAAIWRKALRLDDGEDLLFIPPVYSEDNWITEPVTHIKRMVAEYGFSSNEEI